MRGTLVFVASDRQHSRSLCGHGAKEQAHEFCPYTVGKPSVSFSMLDYASFGGIRGGLS